MSTQSQSPPTDVLAKSAKPSETTNLAGIVVNLDRVLNMGREPSDTEPLWFNSAI